MRLSRAAYAVMIKFSEFFDDFKAMIDEFELMYDTFPEGERDIKMKEHLKTLTNFDAISKRWESASKMRQWINEKKKNLIERIKKEVETEYSKKKEEEKKKKEEEKSKEAEKPKTEEKKSEDVVEQIDTSA